MLRVTLSVIIILSFTILKGQNYTFITDLRYRMVDARINGLIGSRIPPEEFIRNYELILQIQSSGKILRNKLDVVKLYRNNEKSVFVKITVPCQLLDQFKKAGAPGEYVIMVQPFLTTRGGGFKGVFTDGIPFPIFVPDINIRGRESMIIDDNTFGINGSIQMGAPEEVTLKTMMGYLKRTLFEIPFSQEGYSDLVNELDNLKEWDSTTFIPGFTQARRYFQLYEFIDPFVQDNSFINTEHYLLKNRIDSLRRLPDAPSLPPVIPLPGKETDDSIIVVTPNLKDMQQVHDEFTIFMTRLKQYHQKLSLILAASLKKKRIVQEAAFTLAFGPRLSTSFNKQYSVSVAVTDSARVQFQELSKVQVDLSAGVIWRPFAEERTDTAGTNNRKRLPWCLGLFVNYNIAPGSSSLNSVTPAGFALGYGYEIKNIAVMASAGFRMVYHPRQFFIDDFKGQNKVFPEPVFERTDNNYFYKKAIFDVGISLVYMFNTNTSTSNKVNNY